MPKPTQLHAKGKKGKSMQKALNEKKSGNTSDNVSEDTVRQFELELCWCIQQLERNINSKKGTEKDLQETWKVLQVLKNNNQPIIRKRQLMRSYFGDYRAKMQAEEKKLVKMANKIKITDKSEAKATFLRKSVFQTTGDNSFRFGFNITSDQLDNGNTENNAANLGAPHSLPACNSEDSNKSAVRNSTEIPNDIVENNVDTENKLAEDNQRKFEFTFCKSDFKFNFNVDS